MVMGGALKADPNSKSFLSITFHSQRTWMGPWAKEGHPEVATPDIHCVMVVVAFFARSFLRLLHKHCSNSKHATNELLHTNLNMIGMDGSSNFEYLCNYSLINKGFMILNPQAADFPLSRFILARMQRSIRFANQPFQNGITQNEILGNVHLIDKKLSIFAEVVQARFITHVN